MTAMGATLGISSFGDITDRAITATVDPESSRVNLTEKNRLYSF